MSESSTGIGESGASSIGMVGAAQPYCIPSEIALIVAEINILIFDFI